MHSFKCEALLVVISLFVVDLDASRLNIKKIVHRFCAIITTLAGISVNKMQIDAYVWVKVKANLMNNLFVLHVLNR